MGTERALEVLTDFVGEMDAKGIPIKGSAIITTPARCEDFKRLSVFNAHPPSWRKWCGWRSGIGYYEIGTALGVAIRITTEAAVEAGFRAAGRIDADK